MVVQLQWVAFWGGVEDAAHHLLWPFRAAAAALGIAASDMRIWLFLCAVFLLALAIRFTYDELMLRQRRTLATGKVIKFKTDSDGLKTPTIEFADGRGKRWQFDSTLPVNGATGSIGAAVSIIYDPLHPQRAREIGRPVMMAFQAIVSLTLIAGLLVAIYVIP
jgi:hypothetical protein